MTQQQPCLTCTENSEKFGRMVYEICRQTDRQTCSSQYKCIPWLFVRIALILTCGWHWKVELMRGCSCCQRCLFFVCDEPCLKFVVFCWCCPRIRTNRCLNYCNAVKTPSLIRSQSHCLFYLLTYIISASLLTNTVPVLFFLSY